MMKHYAKLKIEWARDIPLPAIALARRRTSDMLTFYGWNIRALDLETLCASCYLQGVEDCLRHIEPSVAKPSLLSPVDFQI